MGLAGNALASLTELKDYMGGLAGMQREEALERSIDAASAIIATHLGRRLVGAAAMEEFHTHELYSEELFLLEWPAVAVTNVWEDATRVYATPLVAGTDYIVSKPGGKLQRISGYWLTGFRAIKVSYTAGYLDKDDLPAGAGAVPADIKDCCLWIASRLFQESERKEFDVSSVTDSLGTVTRFSGSRMPPMIRERLSPYRRRFALGVTGERDA